MLLDSDALDEALKSLDSVQLAKVSGRLVRVSGLILEGLGCHQPTGQRCYVEQTDGSLLEAQVVGFNREITYLMPFKKPLGLATGARIFPIREEARLAGQTSRSSGGRGAAAPHGCGPRATFGSVVGSDCRGVPSDARCQRRDPGGRRAPSIVAEALTSQARASRRRRSSEHYRLGQCRGGPPEVDTQR